MKKLAPLLIMACILTGLSLSLVLSGDLKLPNSISEDEDRHTHTHRHALFHIVINGTEKDLSGSQFQLNAREVHLENNMSDVVHKHAEGVTWRQFLGTINTSIEEGEASEICVNIYNQVRCGSGEIILNGETADLDAEIHQGDRFLIIIDTEGSENLIRDYMKHQIPDVFKPEAVRGRNL